MMGSLKSFIKAVRHSKTIAAERAVIRKESASIRNSFRDINLDHENRSVAISKLLYLYILGEPTYFGQVECLKLLASPKFSHKRLGYLATMLILDEEQEVLTLLTNSLDNDMKSHNQYIAGLALVTLGNLASTELARDLYANVENLLSSQQVYLRKKACIVAAKLIDKDPDLSEIYISKIEKLLNEKSHGCILGCLQLIKSIYKNDESSHNQLKTQIHRLLAHLRLLSSTGYSPEYDVKGIPDPFLYVSLLQTIRLLLENDDQNPNLEVLNDLLTQIASKVDNSCTASNSILYETVNTIFVLNTDSSLKVLGIKILGNCLSTKDNNTRYVALNILLSVINHEPSAVQRHRQIIFTCLQDADVSIRRRALELTFAIINEKNLKLVTKELLVFLKTLNDDELKEYTTTHLTIILKKYSNDLKWHFEVLIKLLNLAGNFFTQDILSSILALIIQNSKDLKLTKFIVFELFKNSYNNYNQFGLDLVTIWCLGEFGDLIINESFIENEDSKTTTTKTTTKTTNQKKIFITESLIVDLFEAFSNLSTFDNSNNLNQIKLYILSASLKLTSRFKSSKQIERLRQIIINGKSDSNLEIQFKAVEYSVICSQPTKIKNALLERMPPPPEKIHEGASLVTHNNNNKNSTALIVSSSKSTVANKTNDLLLDLLGEDNPITNSESTNVKAQMAAQKTSQTLDFLSDIFGKSSTTSSPTSSTVTNSPMPSIPTSASTPAPAPVKASVPSPTSNIPSAPQIFSNNNDDDDEMVDGFQDENITIGFIVKQIGEGSATLISKVLNNSNNPITNMNVLCAVSKQQKLQLSPISSNFIQPKNSSIINLKINGKIGSKVKLRVKISYDINGETKNNQFDFSGLKQTL